jgi:hypothetical protein
MTGGLMQLAVQGQLNIPMFNNPSISFFNYAYKKHTNYAMDNIRVELGKKPSMINIMHEGGFYDTNLRIENVDLLSNIYLIFKLPAIYSSDKYKFKWVEHVGTLLIKKATIILNGSDIDTLTGEWLVIWNELTIPVKEKYNSMTGNIQELINPRMKETIYRINNNIISEYDYLSSTKENINTPSIEGRYVSIPLSFWFSKHPSLALPLVSFNTSVVLRIEFENIEKLYTIYSELYNMHISPTYYNLLNNTKITINDFIINNSVDVYLELTYIVLDTDERNSIKPTITPIRQYLIETPTINTQLFQSGGNESIRNIDINSQLLVKEIIWTLKRVDSMEKFNDTLNFTYSIPRDNEKSIMKDASVIWFKSTTTPRVASKKSFYYNTIQPYEHHGITPRQGIYCYSYSLYPDKWFPSGCYNSASISAELSMTLNDYNVNLIDKIYQNKFNENYKISTNNNDISITTYIIQYNILEFNLGGVGLKNKN